MPAETYADLVVLIGLIATISVPTEKGEPMKIDELELSVRTYNCLKRVGIDTVEKLLTMSDADLMKIRCFGVVCIS